MSSWSEGYVDDIGYTFGFYRELTPAILAVVALAKGQRGFDPNAQLTYCELGCGQGLSTNLHAAANPHIDFHATDFNPSQIVGAKGLAAEAGTPNVHFYDQAFADFVHEPALPPAFDIIALHGIYSWISVENRGHIVEFIRRKLKPGGIVYISYNALPGWAAVMPLRRLFVDQAAIQSGPMLGRVEGALAFVEKLKGTNPSYFRVNPGLADRFDKIKVQPRSYLAHEYFNLDWTPFYHADVVGELDEAKLSFLGSAALLEHIDQVNLTADQQRVLAEINDLTLRETMRDFMVNQQFRRDVFVKGSVGLSANEIRNTWLDMRLVLSNQRANIPLKVNSVLGEVALQPDVYNPIIDGLVGAPRTVRQLLTDNKALVDFGWSRLIQAFGVLIGMGAAQPCLDEKGDARRSQRTKAFNTAVFRRAQFSTDLQFVASPVTGGAYTLDRLNQLILLAQQQKQSDPVKFVREILKAQGQNVIKDGKVLQTEEENLAEISSHVDNLRQNQMPILKQLGIA